MVERPESVHGVERALEILTLFGRAGETLGVSEIAREMGVAKSVVHRNLQAFVAKGYVVIDERTRRYSLGPAVLALGLGFFGRLGLRVEDDRE